MSRHQSLSRQIDDILAAGGDVAIQILRLVHSTPDISPYLKGAAGSALFIFSKVKRFQENKKEWEDFGNYVVENVAEVVAAIRSYDPSSMEAKLWVESAVKLDGALQKIRTQIQRRLTQTNKRSSLVNALSLMRDPGRIKINDLKKDLAEALASFPLRVNLGIGVKLPVTGDSISYQQRQNSWYRRRPHSAYYHSTGPCLNGTRVDLIERIMTWCRNTRDNDNRLMLLTAVAGAGKTSIAHTVAERCAKDDGATLLLSFSFKAGERSWPEHLLRATTQALENCDPVYCTFIASARQKDPALSMAPLPVQFKKLVASPLLHKPPLSNRPMVVIIDALDECNKKAFEPLAHILREEIPKLPSSIKFFITSRQSDIVNHFLSSHLPIDRLTINLSDDGNVRDCAMYIRSELQALMSCHPNIRLQDEERTVQEISERAGGLFIWISTIFRYMKMTNNDPMRTLEKLLGADADGSVGSAEETMDCLYTSILKKCDWEDENFVHDYPIVMGAIFAAQQPLSTVAWDAILSPFLRSSVRYMLSELAPLLEGVEDPHIPIRILHQSFRDFILDRIHPRSISLRCSPVYVKMGNARIALRCTQILNQDLCSIASLGLIKNLSAQDELPQISPEELSEHLHYACCYIIYHLSGVQVPSQALHESVHMFLSHHASRWVEVCVRMEGYINISTLPEWAKLAVDQKSKTAMRMLANVLIPIQSNLDFFSRFHEAYEAANDLVVLCRYLVSVDSQTYNPELARSLNTLYLAIFRLGRHSEALPFIEESVKLHRQLVAVRPTSYTPDLAVSLNNLYNALSNLGRHSEALPFIKESVKLRRRLHSKALPFIEESVKLYRQLVAVDPESYATHLASSLNNHFNALSNIGRHTEALPFIEESVRHYRQLVTIHAASCTPDLALSLNSLCSALSNLGRHEEALPFIDESVQLYRRLVAVHPGSYTSDLARSLDSLRSALSNLGRHSEALPFIEESVRLYHQLVAHSFECRTALGALPFIEESVNLYRKLVALHPGSYDPHLASSLNNLCNALSKLERHPEALPFIEESVRRYRRLVADHSGSHTPDLALSLNNQYKALSNLGRHSEALPLIEESVKLRRQLVAVNAGSYTPGLALSLYNLSSALSNLGRHSEALLFIDESIKLYRKLAAVNPRSHTSNLEMTLRKRPILLSHLGRDSETLSRATCDLKDLSISRVIPSPNSLPAP
ncbi:uncharacterized protein EI90DRAFT_3116526 [Cantharellus anzutake]|uniref:uncharacterized protein n=1 Tax=Cantharellus anzutake TaxID=1750568 RepID=UPI0019089ACD|nr:uncharacterized protein EI90DRAFT_3116526 [Cantharellus anzutake]KAF8341378.1 hypothetical protein EI90DRAFT_3116526 [Cantharellus anzutake]